MSFRVTARDLTAAHKEGMLVRSFRFAIYPVVLFGSCAVVGLTLTRGANVILVTAGVVASVLLLLTLLERAMPYTPKWMLRKKTAKLDLAHSLVSAFVASPLARISTIALAAWAGGAISEQLGVGLWPASWPLAAQLALALVVADLGIYLGHRFMHATHIGWRIHEVHHTPRKLNAFAAGRSHPLNALFSISCEGIPVMLLGITPEAFAVLATFKAVNGFLQHSNIDLRPGWLSYVLATSDVHRFHHSQDLAESNTNFGNTTMIWDHIFGTFHLPHRQPGPDVGIAGDEIAESYWAHLLAPFRKTHEPAE